jgi:hypothetical protein
VAEYSKADITQWLLGAMAVNKKNGNELQFDCPECDHPQFYFNVAKGVGYCHRATCRETFPLDRLIDVVGYPPELAGYVPALDNIDTVLAKPVALPKEATKIHWDDREVYALETRGVTWEHIQQFDIRSDGKRLYVPVYEGGELVQYNSRRINRAALTYEGWFKAGPKPYRYASGHPITNYFLGWEECRLWPELVLVENTFVSIWLRHLHCTATFGSHLSDTHIDKILHSKVKKVTFLWDSGTGLASEKAVKKLRALGIDCKVITLAGQPDDLELAEIEEML